MLISATERPLFLHRPGRQRRGWAGCGSPDGAVFAPCGAKTALRWLASWPVAETPATHFVRCGQTVGDSQFTKRAARAGHESSQLRRPVPIGAPQPPHPRLCRHSGALRTTPSEHTRFVRGGGRYALGAISGATEKIGFGDGVRSTLRRLTHRHCLTTANEVSGGSLAMHPRSRASSCSRPARADRPGMSPQRMPPAAPHARQRT